MRHATLFTWVVVLAVALCACGTNSEPTRSDADPTTQLEPGARAPSDQDDAGPEVAPRYLQVDSFPESIVVDGFNVYVSHFGGALAPMTKDGDGYVAIYNADGERVETFVDGLNAPKGLWISNGVLLVADIDRLVGFDLQTRNVVYDIDFSGETQFLNAITEVNGYIFVTATDVGKVYRVDLDQGTFETFAEVPGANGISYDVEEQLLYVVGYVSSDPTAGRIHAIDVLTRESTVETKYGGMLDGAEVIGDALYFSDWNPAGGGRIMRYPLRDAGEPTLVVESDDLAGPADFASLGGMLLVPTLQGNRLMSVRY